jgi:hypothetical protein
MDMSFVLRKLQGSGKEAATAEAASTVQGGGLAVTSQEGLPSLQENAGHRKGASPRFDDQLLPPPPKARPTAEEYDMMKDPHLFEDSLLPEPPYGASRSRATRARAGSATRNGVALSIKMDE